LAERPDSAVAGVGAVSDVQGDWPGGFSAACVRNCDPILQVLQQQLTCSAAVLEVGSCTGQHAVAFAKALPMLSWQTSDQSIYLPGLQANLDKHSVHNVIAPLALNVVTDAWPDAQYDVVYTANTLHIMSLEQVEASFVGIGRVLADAGRLVVYGPFIYGGRHTSESNAAFDASLKQRDALSGIRDFEYIATLAERQGLSLQQDYEMPANNRLLVWSLRNG
jgi:hypothetical protein